MAVENLSICFTILDNKHMIILVDANKAFDLKIIIICNFKTLLKLPQFVKDFI